MQVFHIQAAPPLYTNTFLLIGANGNAVAVDPSAEAQSYLDLLQENDATLTQILLTHGHYDHVSAAKTLQQATGARIHLNPQDGVNATDRRLFPLQQADCAYTDGETITVDDMMFRILCTPGHSAGAVVILCGDLLFSGDLLFQGDIGRTDLEGGSQTQMLQSLARVWQLVPDETQILPGHGAFSHMYKEKQTNPYLQQAAKELL